MSRPPNGTSAGRQSDGRRLAVPTHAQVIIKFTAPKGLGFGNLDDPVRIHFKSKSNGNSNDMNAEILLFPYDAAVGESLFHRLIAELGSGSWTRLRAAVAFAKVTGNSDQLLTSLSDFASAGGTVSLTFGADTFGADSGTDLQAIEQLVDRFEAYPNAQIHLYHESGRTFHPKIYLFDNETEQQALLIFGSSNWSYGGLAGNVEASILLRLSLNIEEEREIYDRLVYCFANYWTES